jgi:beta-phosphoglucomutase-like phosphatase (HAD superfamily)
LTVPLAESGGRLEIEIALLEVEDGLVDLAARREALATRIRAAVANNEAEPAIKLVGQLRAMPGADALLARLEQAQQALVSADRSTQQRFGAKLADLRKLAEQLNSERPVEKLEAELKGSP